MLLRPDFLFFFTTETEDFEIEARVVRIIMKDLKLRGSGAHSNLFTLSIQRTLTHMRAHANMFPSQCLSLHCGLKNKFMHRVIISSDKTEYVGFSFFLFPNGIK